MSTQEKTRVGMWYATGPAQYPGHVTVRNAGGQAFKYGEKHMPKDLRRAGFETVIFTSDPVIHGGSWFRINYGK